MMEQLKLAEPIDRQWVRDPIMSINLNHPNLMSNAFNAFLKYLEIIRTMKREHWKSLEFHEGNPNKLLKSLSMSRETSVSVDGIAEQTLESTITSSLVDSSEQKIV